MAIRERTFNRGVLVGLMGLAILMSLFGQRAAAPLRKVARFLLIAPTDMNMYVVTALRGGDELARKRRDPRYVENLEKQVGSLQSQVAYYHDQMDQYRREVRELQNWQKVFGPNDKLDRILIPARVASDDALPYGDTRVVNVGQRQAVQPGDDVTTRRLLTDRSRALGQFDVMSQNVLVGRIIESGPYTARMILVTDKRYTVKAKVIRDPGNPRIIGGRTSEEELTDKHPPVPCTAAGDGRSGLIVTGARTDENVQPGDRLLAIMKREGYSDYAIPIGTVTAKEEDPHPDRGGYDRLHVSPDVNLAGLRRVYVIYHVGRRQPREP